MNFAARVQARRFALRKTHEGRFFFGERALSDLDQVLVELFSASWGHQADIDGRIREHEAIACPSAQAVRAAEELYPGARREADHYRL